MFAQLKSFFRHSPSKLAILLTLVADEEVRHSNYLKAKKLLEESLELTTSNTALINEKLHWIQTYEEACSIMLTNPEKFMLLWHSMDNCHFIPYQDLLVILAEFFMLHEDYVNATKVLDRVEDIEKHFDVDTVRRVYRMANRRYKPEPEEQENRNLFTTFKDIPLLQKNPTDELFA